MTVNAGIENKEKKPKQGMLMSKAAQPKNAAAHSFLSGIKSEFSKITWTSKEELIVYTKAVVGATLVFGFGVYFIDVLIQLGIRNLESIFRLIFG